MTPKKFHGCRLKYVFLTIELSKSKEIVHESLRNTLPLSILTKKNIKNRRLILSKRLNTNYMFAGILVVYIPSYTIFQNGSLSFKIFTISYTYIRKTVNTRVGVSAT